MKKLLTYPEASEYLSINQGTLRNMVYNRDIPFVKIGRMLRFDVEELNIWINTKRSIT